MLCLGTDLEKHIVLGINRLIRVRANHCYGCTAGAGSSLRRGRDRGRERGERPSSQMMCGLWPHRDRRTRHPSRFFSSCQRRRAGARELR